MLVAGFDEVGRGAWAGPLVIAGVVLDTQKCKLRLRDSKLYNRRNREALAAKLYPRLEHVYIEVIDNKEIDELSLGGALRDGFMSCYRELRGLADEYVVDGNINFFAELEPKSKAVVGADDLVRAVSAASIVSKVFRDKYMEHLGEYYPEYKFEHHVGYGTLDHKLAIENHGVSSYHRRTFRPITKAL